MIDKNEILKIAKHAFKRGKGVPDKRIMHPARDWALGILIFTTVLIAGGSYSAVNYEQFRNIDTSNGDAGERIPRYQETLINEQIDLYQKKKTEFGSLTKEPAKVDEEVSSSTASTSESVASSTVEVVVSDVFPEKLVYGDNMDLDTDALKLHCEAKGGVFNECGSVCPATAEVCTMQCAFTCEFEIGEI